ncbi:MAG: hypothetical protein ABI454_02000 [Sphingomicrobium sp.]
MSPYARLVSTRKVFAVLLALAVLIAPGMTSAAMAAAPHHDMQMMEAGHCQTPPASTGGHDKMGGKSCCIAMCMALAVAPSSPADTSPPRQQIAEFAAPRAYHGLPAEIATPPPRRS